MTANKSWTVKPTAAGLIKTRYPLGDDTAEPPTWATIPNFLQKSAAFSTDISQYLSGSYSTITLSIVTGALAGTGWSFAGTTLTYSGTGSGTLSVRFQAIGATTANSNVVSLESIVQTLPDTFAPAQVTGFTASLNASNKPVLGWKASADPAPANTFWSGRKDDRLYRDSVLLTTLAAASTGVQAGFTAASVGTQALGGSFAQNGATLTLSGSGTNYFNTADSGEIAYKLMSGDFFAYGQVTAFTSANALSKCMIDARASLAQEAAHVAAVVTQDKGVNGEYRTTASASALANTKIANASFPWVALGRVANLFTIYYSLDGLAWITHSSVTVALPSQVFLGYVVAACQAGITATATIANTAISQSVDISYTDISAGDGATYTYSVKARDNALNESIAAAITVTTAPPLTDVAARWQYLKFGTPASPITSAYRGMYTNSGQAGGWWDFTGTDAATGYVQPPESVKAPFWGGTSAPYASSNQIIASPGNALTDQTRAILTETVSGSTYNFYRNTMSSLFYGGPVGGSQNDYVIWPASNGTQGMYYMRKWVRIVNADFQTRMRNASRTTIGATPPTKGESGFMVISGSKTAPSSARVTFEISNTNSKQFADTTQSYFQITFDGFVRGTQYQFYKVFVIGPNPSTTLTNVLAGPAVPVGSWFLVEHAFRQSTRSDGWCWIAINGAEIFRYKGVTMDDGSQAGHTAFRDVNGVDEKINRLFPHSVYTNADRSPSSPLMYDVKQLECWTAWPADATAHPNYS